MSEAAAAAHTEQLLGFLGGGRRVVVITGAGCSTASGIGDYRDRNGAWKRTPPMQMQAFVDDPAARRRYWARSMLGWPVVADARPNAAHRALAALEAAGIVTDLITQNVDGLHQRAGQRRVLELHGALDRVVCLDCGARSARRGLQQRLEAVNGALLRNAAAPAPDGDADLADGFDLGAFEVPECRHCGGRLKPDVVFYGDSVPRARVAAAARAVDAADVLLVVGSSLMVFSSFRFCRQARQRGLPIVALNRGVTRADPWLALKVEMDCALALPALAAALAGR